MVSKQRILIVDDDNNIAELISLYLTKECYETLIVNDGESVMPSMKNFVPNLILLDVMLPGADGYDVMEYIRRRSYYYAFSKRGNIRQSSGIGAGRR